MATRNYFITEEGLEQLRGYLATLAFTSPNELSERVSAQVSARADNKRTNLVLDWILKELEEGREPTRKEVEEMKEDFTLDLRVQIYKVEINLVRSIDEEGRYNTEEI